MTHFKADQKTKDWGNDLRKQLNWKLKLWSEKKDYNKLIDLPRVFDTNSTSSLDLHDTRVFLYFEPRHYSNHLFSSRLHWRNCSLLTLPCFHSQWRGQQHEDSNGILGGSRGHHHRYLHLFTTDLHNYIQNVQIYSTVIAKNQIGTQGDNPEQCFQGGYHVVKFEARGQNLHNSLRPHTNSLKLVITIDRNHFVPFSESSELKSPIFVEK